MHPFILLNYFALVYGLCMIMSEILGSGGLCGSGGTFCWREYITLGVLGVAVLTYWLVLRLCLSVGSGGICYWREYVVLDVLVVAVPTHWLVLHLRLPMGSGGNCYWQIGWCCAFLCCRPTGYIVWYVMMLVPITALMYFQALYYCWCVWLYRHRLLMILRYLLVLMHCIEQDVC
ncbi:uncharacterized protein B0H18DRAFT_1045012 [Fomitopsis serialis]|uniref:uncharacterized protein n=1 Tax=Fomitopsis serialis TaxID=139415 RepID=UPI0020073111|nr:uncharacterized protein B0H18DRAFT_1045012 [Neoantrodia serialis]KAH9914547.1 hypothetical protein B0H18DRAFT_1045012 [Neoantrodia serialis]